MKRFRALIFSIIWSVAIILLYVGLRSGWHLVGLWSDGAFIAGFSLVCFALLVLLSSKGAFDIFAYPFKKHNPGDSFYDYMQRKEEDRKKIGIPGFLPMILTGIILITLAGILLIFR